MKLKPFSTFVLAAGLTSSLCGGDAPPAPLPFDSSTNKVRLTPAWINQLADAVRTNHPALRAAEARNTAAAAGTAAVRIWEDPMLMLGGTIADKSMREEDGDLLYGVQQKLPLFGKAQQARKVARVGQAIGEATRDSRFQELRRELAKALFRTALAARVVEIGRQDLVWVETLAATLEQRQAAGQAPAVELLSAQNERARRRDSLRTDQSRVTNEWVVLNRLLGRPWATPWPVLELPPPAEPVPFSPALADLAARYEPRIRVMRREIEQAEATIELTRRQRYPDFTVGAEGWNYSGNGEFRQAELRLSFNLPLGNSRKYRSDILREQSRRDAAAFELADAEAAVRQEVHQLTVEIDAARREMLLFRDEVVPRSQAALAAATAAWEAGRSHFTDVLLSRRLLLEAELSQERALADHWQRLADLVLCCGLADLEALEMLRNLPESDATPANRPSTSLPR